MIGSTFLPKGWNQNLLMINFQYVSRSDVTEFHQKIDLILITNIDIWLIVLLHGSSEYTFSISVSHQTEHLCSSLFVLHSVHDLYCWKTNVSDLPRFLSPQENSYMPKKKERDDFNRNCLQRQWESEKKIRKKNYFLKHFWFAANKYFFFITSVGNLMSFLSLLM